MYTNTDLWTWDVQRNYRKLRELLQLYRGEQECVFVRSGKRIPFRYVTKNELRRIVRNMATLETARKPRVTPAGTKEQKDSALDMLCHLQWWQRCFPLTVMRRVMGYADVKLLWDPRGGQDGQGGPAWRLWGMRDGEFCTILRDPSSPSMPTVYNFWSTIYIWQDKMQSFRYWYKWRERHELTPTGTLITNTAFPLYGLAVEAVPAAWSSVASAWTQSAQPEEEYFVEGLTLPPMYRLNNVTEDANELGESDIDESLRNFQEAINITISSRQYVIRQTEEPVIQADERLVAENRDPRSGQVDLDGLRRQVVRNGQSYMYDVKNWPGHLPNSEFQWTHLEDGIYDLSDLSPALDGRASAGGDSGYARRLGLLKPEAAAKRGQETLTPYTVWLMRIGMQMNQVFRRSTVRPIETANIEYPPVIPDDPNEVSQRCSLAAKDGVMSRRTYIESIHPDWDPERVDQEIAQLDEEDAKKQANALTNFGAFPPAAAPPGELGQGAPTA